MIKLPDDIKAGSQWTKRSGSKLSTDRYKIVKVQGDSVVLNWYNFFKKEWNKGEKFMKKDVFIKNYEPAEYNK